jgi:Lhr-like helicase
MDFLDKLHPLVSKWFKARFKAPTEVQSGSVPLILDKKNVLITSPTGTGKTLAAFIGIINDLLTEKEEKGIFCVYISPLRALNRDIERNLAEPLEEIYELAELEDIELPKVSIGIRTSDTSNYEKTKMLRKPPDILITTPESFSIALATEKFSQHLKNVKYVVIDEIHEVCSSKRGVDLSLSLERLEHMNSRPLIRVGISATIAPVEEISAYLGGYLEGRPRPVEPVIVSLRKDTDLDLTLPVPDIFTASVGEVWAGTLESIKDLISHHGTTIVFTNTRRLTERMVLEMSEKGVQGVQAHHGSLSREHRLQVESDLKSGHLKAVVCSTSLELGIDIGAVDLVVQVGTPRSIYRLVQRIGRAGHTLEGTCKGRIIPQSPLDLLECAAMVRAVHNGRLDSVGVPKNCLDVLAQGLLGLVLQGPTTYSEAYEIIKRSRCFYRLTKKDFNIALNFLSGKKGCPPGTYAKVHHEPSTGTIIPRKGSRYIYFLNSGTIPPEVSYRVVEKREKAFIGTLSQDFGQMLRQWDIFLLSGRTFQVISFKGQTIFVRQTPGKKPTIPRWHSEVPSRTVELSSEIRSLLSVLDMNAQDLASQIGSECGISGSPAKALADFLHAQALAAGEGGVQPNLLLEGYIDPRGRKCLILHTFATRRVNSTLGRVLGKIIKDTTGLDTQVVVSDDHLLLTFGRMISFKDLFSKIDTRNMERELKMELMGSEMFRQNFRLNAQRSLMILKRRGTRSAKNHYRLALRILDSLSKEDAAENLAVKETYREALDRFLDVGQTRQLLKALRSGRIRLATKNYSQEPTPFSFQILQTGIWDGFDQGMRTREALALAASKLQPEFTSRQLEGFFPGEAGTVDVEGLLEGLGPLTYQDLKNKRRGGEEELTQELYGLIETGLVITGYFKTSKQRVQYMLKRDWRTLKLKEAGLRGAVYDASKLRSALLSCSLSLKDNILIIGKEPFIARGQLTELRDMLRSGQAFRFRLGGRDAYLHRENLGMVTGALRATDLTKEGLGILRSISECGDTSEALRKRSGLRYNTFQSILDVLMENLYVLGAKSSSGEHPVDLVVRNPVEDPPPREEGITELTMALIKGYGVQSENSLVALTNEMKIPEILLELVRREKVAKGYLALEELVEVFVEGPVMGEPHGIQFVPPTDPAMVLDGLHPTKDWQIFQDGAHVGSFEPYIGPDLVRIKELTLYPDFFLNIDREETTRFFQALLTALKEMFDGLRGPSVYVIETINGQDDPSLVKGPALFKGYGGWLVHGDIWENKYNLPGFIDLVLRRQRIAQAIGHPLEWIERAGHVNSEPALLLRMNKRLYPFDPTNPRSKRVALHSLAELAKINDLYKTYDLKQKQVYSTLKWARLVRAAKGGKPTRKQQKLLKAIPKDTSIGTNLLQERTDLSKQRFKKDLLALKKMNLVLENGYGNLVLNEDRKELGNTEAWTKLVKIAFRDFLLFDIPNLSSMLGDLLTLPRLMSILKDLEEEGILTKGFVVEGDDRLYWIMVDDIQTVGDHRTNRRFILTPKDPLAQYLAPRIKERFSRTSVFTVFKGPDTIGAFKGRLTKSNLVISEIIDINPQDLKSLVEDFSDLNQLKSFKSEKAFKRYKKTKRIRKAIYEDYFYTEAELDDYLEEYESYFGNLEEEEQYFEFRRP